MTVAIEKIRIGEDEIFRVPLTRGLFALVDPGDAPIVQGYKWIAQRGWGDSYYAVRRRRLSDGPGAHLIQLHRMILPPPPGAQIDHINQNTLDCRRSNLRVVTIAENGRNRGTNRNNSTGFKGVYGGENGRWRSAITVDRRYIHLGRFATREEAARAYDEAARKYHGEFACVNFPRSGERGCRSEAP